MSFSFLLAILLGFGWQSRSVQDPFEIWARDTLCHGESAVAFVGQIVSVKDKNATYANPPLVTLFIEEVLKGTFTTSSRLSVLWAPDPQGWRGKSLSIQALDTPLSGPAKGMRLIIVAEGSEEPLTVYLKQRFRYTSKRLATLKRLIEEIKNTSCHS